MVVGRRDVVIDHATRSKKAAVAGPSQAEGEVDVFVVRAEERVESSGLAQGFGAIERTRAAGAEDFFDRTVREEPRRAGRARAWSASRPGCRNRRRSRRGSGCERTRTSGATDPTEGSANGARPASIQPAATSVSLLSNWMNRPRAAAMPALAAAQNPPFVLERNDADVGIDHRQPSAVPSVEASSVTTISIVNRGIGGAVPRDAAPGSARAARGRCRSGSRPSRAGAELPAAADRADRLAVSPGFRRPFRFVPRGLAPEDMLNRHEHDAQVEAERPALDVVEVVLDALAQRGSCRASRGPGPSRSSRRRRRGEGRSRGRSCGTRRRSWAVRAGARPGSCRRGRR